MADIMPLPNPEPRDPSALVDGCPNCVANVEPPWAWSKRSYGYRCAYRCSDCDHAWTTSWGR